MGQIEIAVPPIGDDPGIRIGTQATIPDAGDFVEGPIKITKTRCMNNSFLCKYFSGAIAPCHIWIYTP